MIFINAPDINCNRRRFHPRPMEHLLVVQIHYTARMAIRLSVPRTRGCRRFLITHAYTTYAWLPIWTVVLTTALTSRA